MKTILNYFPHKKKKKECLPPSPYRRSNNSDGSGTGDRVISYSVVFGAETFFCIRLGVFVIISSLIFACLINIILQNEKGKKKLNAQNNNCLIGSIVRYRSDRKSFGGRCSRFRCCGNDDRCTNSRARVYFTAR